MPELDYRTPDSTEKADEQYAPYSKGSTARNLRDQENDGEAAGYDRASDGRDSDSTTGDDSGASGDLPSGTKKNIDDAREREEDGGGWKNNVSGGDGRKRKANLKGFLKKKGPAGAIIGLLIGGGSGMSFLFGPGMLIVDLKERMTDKFNDQLAAMDIRTTTMLKKKFGGTTAGVCGAKITIRCKFNTMSDKQLRKLEAAGVKVNRSGGTLLGRNKIESLEFDGRTIRASEFASELRTNTAFRGAMLKAYNPKLAGFADATFGKLARKLGINKQRNVTGLSEEEHRQSVLDASSGQQAIELDAHVNKVEEPCDSGEDCVDGTRTTYTDENGNTIDESEYHRRTTAANSLRGEVDARRTLSNTSGSVAKSTLKGALTATAMGLGAVDSGCTAYILIRAVGFAAKYLGALQLLRFAQVFMNTADAIKAGVATPEPVEYIGKVLTTPNVEGKGATDSYGVHFAYYGDTDGMPNVADAKAESSSADGSKNVISEAEKQKIEVADETAKYINGQLVSKNILATLVQGFEGAVPTEQLDSICKFVKSGWGQTILIGTAIVGAAVAFFSGGLSLGWGTAAQIAVSVAIGVAMAMLTPKLIDMAAGTLIGGAELKNGNRAGNAITSGMGAMNDQTSAARGVPALKKPDAAAYQELNEQTIAQYHEVDRLNYHPLDPTNRNTFMGSIVSTLLPYTTKLSSVGGGLTALTEFTTTSLASIIPRSYAQDKTAQFNVCKDMDYQDMQLAVDPFCNIRHGLKSGTLAVDSDTVVDYMVKNNYVDEETGAPKEDDNDYANYIKNCMDRTVSIGGFTEDNDDKGEQCIQGNASGAEEQKRDMFRLFYIDVSIDDGMENGVGNSGAGNTTADGTVVSPVTGTPIHSSGYGPRGPIAGAPNASRWHPGIDLNATPKDVVAIMDGIVVSVGGSANTVTIKHADGLKSLYLHMEPAIVKAGDTVKAGQKLGTIGCAGQAQGICSGDHLHFNIFVDEVTDKAKYSKYKVAPTAAGSAAGKAINPANFLTDRGVKGYEEQVNDN